MALERINVLDPQGVQDLTLALLQKTELQVDARIVQELTEEVTNKQVPSALLVKALVEALQAKDTELSEKIDEVKTEVEGSVSTDLNALTERIGTVEGTVTEHGTKITEVDGKADANAAGLVTANEAIDELNKKVAGLTHLTIETVVGDITSVVEPKEDVLYFQKDNEEDKTWVLYIYKAAVKETEYVWPEASSVDNFNFEEITEGEEATATTGNITGLTEEGNAVTELVIPSEINECTVVGISSDASNTTLTTLTIPKTVTSIELTNFEALTDVYYEGTEEEWTAAFTGTLPETVTVHYEYAGEEVENTVSEAKWIVIGDTSIDLVDYWRKDDIEAMKEALGIQVMVPMTSEEINAAVDAAFDKQYPVIPTMLTLDTTGDADGTSETDRAVFVLASGPLSHTVELTADAGKITAVRVPEQEYLVVEEDSTGVEDGIGYVCLSIDTAAEAGDHEITIEADVEDTSGAVHTLTTTFYFTLDLTPPEDPGV